MHYGVREHGMGAVVNGMAYHKGLIPFGATFLVFSDYMRGAIRVSAFSHLRSIMVMTHDSIGLGEDGPTHQPVEHLAALRAIPNLHVIRPADANETAQAWRAAIEYKNGPTILALSRQGLPTLDRSQTASAEGTLKGAYVLADLGKGAPEIILMASGSEVNLVYKAGQKLVEEGHSVRVVSFPCWELFEKAGQDYQDSVLIPGVKNRLAVECGVAQGWEKWTGSEGKIIAMKSFGASAPAGILMDKFGFTVENVLNTARSLLG